MDRIKALEIFVKVADTNSFSRAAELTGLPRSTVSAVISRLESELGTRLLHRTTRQVSPTRDGLTLLERAHPLLRQVEEIETLFRHEEHKVSGRLKIDVPSRIATRLIAPSLPAFFARYPELELTMGATDRTVDLLREGVDCMIRVGPNDSSSLIARRLGKLEIVNCASPAYLAEYGVPSSPDDLPEHWIINHMASPAAQSARWEYRNGEELGSVSMRSRVTVTQADNHIACALAGLGLIQAPAYDVQQHLRAGELQEVLKPWQADPMPVSALYPRRRPLSLRVLVFIDWVSDLLRSTL